MNTHTEASDIMKSAINSGTLSIKEMDKKKNGTKYTRNKRRIKSLISPKVIFSCARTVPLCTRTHAGTQFVRAMFWCWRKDFPFLSIVCPLRSPVSQVPLTSATL